MNRLKDLAELARLRHIAKDGPGLNISQLEQDFLTFSSYIPKRTLDVRFPKLYQVDGEEVRHLDSALEALGQRVDPTPRHIDISGGFDYDNYDAMVFLSLSQINTDHFSRSRAYLDPLIEKVYSDGAPLIRDFSIHEALAGHVKCMRGDLDLSEITLFPERFSPGPYTLSLELRTPEYTVRKFRDLNEKLDRFRSEPKASLLDSALFGSTVADAIELRTRIGSLSRYDVPNTQEFCAAACSCITDRGEQYHLYSPAKNTNLLVYFGEAPLKDAPPKGLALLDGRNYQSTLAALIESRILEPSDSVLNLRIRSLRLMREDATRSAKKSLSEYEANLNALIDRLTKAQDRFRQIVNLDMRRDYIMKQQAEVAEFMVYPTTNDPVMHELLPRISWNSAVRAYNSTKQFITEFSTCDDAKRKEILSSLGSGLMFSNQQNNDINVWLYANHKDFCQKNGIEFNLL